MTAEPAPAPPPPDPRAARRHLAVALLAINALVFVLSRPWAVTHQLHELIGLVFLAAAIVAIRRDDDDTRRYGVRLDGLFPGAAGDPRSHVRPVIEALPSALRELGAAAVAAAVILPPYTLLWPMFNRPVGARHLDASRLGELVVELLAVAFTEEFLFRGYVQTRLADALGWGAIDRSSPWRKALAVSALTALLFAATHVVVSPTAARAAVFFPGVIFGLLRVWRGGIGAAVALHAVFNLYERWLEGR